MKTSIVTRRGLRILSVLAISLTLWPVAGGTLSLPPAAVAHAGPLVLGGSYGRLPLAFEPNRGQSLPGVDYLAHAAGYTLLLTGTEAIVTAASGPSTGRELSNGPRRAPGAAPPRQADFRVRLIGANPQPEVDALDRLPGKVNYFIGNNPRRWRTDLPTYRRIVFRRVYPGIDLTYDGSRGEVETIWTLYPGARPGEIRLAVLGGRKPRLDSHGNLALSGAVGRLLQTTPRVYQEVGGHPHGIAARFTVSRRGELGFALGHYDRARPLVIDPVLEYASYLGGSDQDIAHGVAVDSQGSVYVTGSTASANFPTASPFQPALTGSQDAFVTKLNAAGTAALFSTYLGGTGEAEGNGVAVDSAGNVYLTGDTMAADFPALQALPEPADCVPNNSIISPGPGMCVDHKVFVTKLGPAGNTLIFSTLLGGNGYYDDFGYAIATDAGGEAYVTGTTFSNDFPTTPGAFESGSGLRIERAFVTKFGAGGNMVYGTSLGGSFGDVGFGIAVDAQGSAYVDGITDSPDFPIAQPFQATFTCPGGGTSCDAAFVAKLNQSGTAIVYSTFLGDADAASAIALDTAGDAYITGSAAAPDLAGARSFVHSMTGASCTDSSGTPAPCSLAFAAKISSSGSLAYSAYLGGAGDSSGKGIAVDASGDAFITGVTDAANFPLANPVQSASGGGNCSNNAGNNAPCSNAFLTELTPGGNSLVSSTYLGGPGDNEGNAVAVDSSGNAFVAGMTSSTAFPVRQPLQAQNAGGEDAFVVKVGSPPTPTPTPTATSTPLPTATPSPTPRPKKAKTSKCKKGYHLVHGKCKKK